jgi:hypothetical protein
VSATRHTVTIPNAKALAISTLVHRIGIKATSSDGLQIARERISARFSARFDIDAVYGHRYECGMKRDLTAFAIIALLLLLICATVAGVAMRLYEIVG